MFEHRDKEGFGDMTPTSWRLAFRRSDFGNEGPVGVF